MAPASIESGDSKANGMREGRPSRLRLPRFGLRFLFVFALVFCLFFAWIGRNAYRMRQEDAAIETLKQAHATIHIRTGGEVKNHPATPHAMEPPDWDSLPSFPMRLFGLSGPAEVTYVRFHDDLPKDKSLDQALAALARFPTIETMEFGGTAFTNESLDSLTPLPNLRELAIFSKTVTGDRLARIASPERLRVLKLSGLEPSLAAVFASMTELREVHVYRVAASRADIEALASLPHLESLNLVEVRHADEGFYAPLAKAQSLKKLLISGSSFGDADAETLGKLTRLERLVIAGITDAGVAELYPLTNLRWVEFKKPVTPAARRAFSAAHERCVVMGWTPEGKQHYYLAGEEIDRKTAYEFDAAAGTAED